VRHEEQQRAEVGRAVHDLRLRAGGQEVVAEERDHREDEERAGAGAEDAVVEADDQAHGAGHAVVTAAGVPQGGHRAQGRPQQGPDGDDDQGDDDDRLEDRRREQGGDRRPGEAAGQREPGHGQGGAEVRVHPPVERDRARGGAEHAAQLVGGQRLHGADARDEQQRGQLQEPSPAHHRVDEPGGEPGEQHEEHGRGGQPVGQQFPDHPHGSLLPVLPSTTPCGMLP
jgi:hypothetical protein